MIYYFVYKTTNLINGHYYIGVHQTNNLNDGYLGSGKRLHSAIKKYGIENFKREILRFFDNPEDMFDLERFLVTPKEVKSKECYNINVGGHGGWEIARNKRTQESFDKTSEKLKQRFLNKENHPMYGKHHSDETKQKQSEKKLGKKPSIYESTIEKHRMQKLGTHHSEETKEKMRMSRLGKHFNIPKLKWLTPEGDIVIMSKQSAHRFHKDYILIQN